MPHKFTGNQAGVKCEYFDNRCKATKNNKMEINKKPSIDYYNELNDYDHFANKHKYVSPELFFETLQPFLDKKKSLLDLGVGTGLISEQFTQFGLTVVGVDGSEKLLRVCKSKGFCKDLLLHDLYDGTLPEMDMTFDIVVSSGVFEFVHNLSAMFINVYHHMNYDGIFCLSIRDLENNSHIETIEYKGMQIDKNAYEKHGIVCIHYPIKDVEKKLTEAKFKVKSRKKYRAYHSPTNNIEMYNVLILCSKYRADE